MKWISVGDELPETSSQYQMVIVATDRGIGVADYDKINGFVRVNLSGPTQHSHVDVTHWMYIPAQP